MSAIVFIQNLPTINNGSKHITFLYIAYIGRSGMNKKGNKNKGVA